MSCAARDWVWSRRGLTPAQRLVLLALAEHADARGGSCFPSLGTLEAMTGLSRRGVTKALEALDGPLLTRDRGGPGQVTRYQLRLERTAAPCAVPEDIRVAQGIAFPREPGSLGNTVPALGEQGSLPREHSSPDLGNTVPPNRHKNRQLTVNEPLPQAPGTPGTPGAPSRPRARSSAAGTPPRPIPPDWTPGERVLAWAAKQGLAPAWVSAQVDEFVVYWTDAGAARKSWDATFIHRLRDLQAQPQRSRHAATHTAPRAGIGGGLAAKDYHAGATPLEQIPWLDLAALG